MSIRPEAFATGLCVILAAISGCLLLSFPKGYHPSENEAKIVVAAYRKLSDRGRSLQGNLSACTGKQDELAACNPVPCVAFAPPVDCVWGTWSTWAACDCGGTHQRYRAVEREGGRGGKLCEGPEREIQQCTPICDAQQRIDCRLTTWDAWSACTRSCENGQQYRSREIARQQRNGGQLCNGTLHETQACNTQDCPGSEAVDCQWGLWDSWSPCSVTCGSGDHRRSRRVDVSPRNGGKLCEALTAAEVSRCGVSCNGTDMDCKWSQWSPWSGCSKSCDGGIQFRMRSIAHAASNLGSGCIGRFEDFRSCGEAACIGTGQDCLLGDWSQWSTCSAHCNGHHQRTRGVVVMARGGGKLCTGSTEEVTPCNTGSAMCAVKNLDCKYSEWASWSTCSRTCGGGDSEQKRSIMVHSEGTGEPCNGDLRVARRCNSNPCEGFALKDCQWSPWGRWSVCTTTCGGGQKRRHRSIVVEAQHGGRACSDGAGIEVDQCSMHRCVEKWMICEWAQWSAWSACIRDARVVTCGGGQQKRTRISRQLLRSVDPATQHELKSPSAEQRLLTSDIAGAVACKQIQDEVQPCADHSCKTSVPQDCMWGAWNSWSSCPCNGLHERHRVILKVAEDGGSACEGPQVQAEPCKANCEDVVSTDCQYGAWTEWSACPVTCGGGRGNTTRIRRRTIVQQGEGHGEACEGRRVENSPCNTDPCPPKQDCVWGPWTDASACSKTCGGGESSRSRIIMHPASNGGRPCEMKDNVRVNACNLQPCPALSRDCEFTAWNDWQKCPVSCGGSLQHRSRTVLIAATIDGLLCDGELQEFRQCGTEPCFHLKQVDCAWGTWSIWSACNSLCNGHKERNRAIARAASAGGHLCEGPERVIYPCNLDTDTCKATNPQDCVFGDWNAWTSCSRHCGGGQHFRNREIDVHARNYGKPCSGTLQESQACGTIPCNASGRVDCQWGFWSEWSACSRSCDGGQATRIRGIDKESRGGGRPCKAQPSMEMRPCNVDECGKPQEACEWSDWTEWEACSRSCDGGQQQRARQRQWRPDDVLGQEVYRTSNRQLFESLLPGSSSDCAGAQQELRACSIVPCDGSALPVACHWDVWSDWSACSCEGLQERSRGIDQRATGGGRACLGPTTLTRRCQSSCYHDTINCEFSIWMDWSHCSATCGGGQMTRVRLVQKHSQGLGAGCHGQLSEMQACSTQLCTNGQQDCTYTSWSQWSACSRSCGGGQRARRRSVHEPKLEGRFCQAGALEELAACGTVDCHAPNFNDCQWSEWASWTPCSVTCGIGKHARRRQIHRDVQLDGKPCSGVFQEYDQCHVMNCSSVVVDCRLWPWSEWNECTATCSGHTERVREIELYAIASGRPCDGPLRQIRPCGSGTRESCPNQPEGSRDCEMSTWAAWSDCSHSCGVGQRFSSRRIIHQAHGVGRVCGGSLRRTLPCNLAPCEAGMGPVNCTWGPWSSLSTCSAQCGGGERTRRRTILMEASNGGQRCVASVSLQVLPCGTQPCAGEQCVWTPWSTWSPCSVSCGGGQTKRRRSLAWTDMHSSSLLGASNLNEQTEVNALRQSPTVFVHEFVTAHRSILNAFAVIGVASTLIVAAVSINKCACRANTFRRQERGSIYIELSTEEPDDLDSEDMERPMTGTPHMYLQD